MIKNVIAYDNELKGGRQVTPEMLERLRTALTEGFRNMGITRKGDMAKHLGYQIPYFSGMINGRERLSNSFLNTLSSKVGINPTWILTGEGTMLIEEEAAPKVEYGREVPLVPLCAHAGSLAMFSDSARRDECELIVSPLRDIDMALTVAGESMTPDIPNGSIILVKRIYEQAFIEWGKIYVMDTRNGIVVKILTPATRPGYVRCVSANPDARYAPFDVNLDDVFGIYAVKLCMTRK